MGHRCANEIEDLLNIKKMRNRYNTSTWDYNCGGFALNTFTWYCPARNFDFDYKESIYGMGDNDFFDLLFGTDCYSTREMYYATRRCVRAMLHDFDDLRIIKDLKELAQNEYAIAFRISGEMDDFHFMRRTKSGKWFHKMGATAIRPIKKEEVFAEIWDLPAGNYCGELILFAKKY